MRGKKKRKKSLPGKTTVYRPLFITVILILLILTPWIIWLIRPEVPLNLLVYNKSVPENPAVQHLGLGWILHHLKIPQSEGIPHSTDISYRGYHPDLPEKDRISPLFPIPDDIDIVYIADTYGVYRNNNDITTVTEDGVRNLIYGGVNQNDVDALRSFLNRDEPNIVIAEYNTFATPTPDYIQSQLYEMFRVEWTGWSGLYINNLAIGGDCPPWVYPMYERHTGKSWNYRGSGILLYNTAEEVVVLTMEADLSSQANIFEYTPKAAKTLGLQGSFSYNRMFDIVIPLSDAQILGTYTLDTTASGMDKLENYGIPSSFPAIIQSTVAEHTTYYFAGNWAYSRTPLKFSFLAGVPTLMQRSIPEDLDSEHFFQWHVYMPLLRSIFSEAEFRKQNPTPKTAAKVVEIDHTTMVSRTQENMLQVWKENEWKDLFIHGVNLGIAMPGKWFTDFPNNKALYYRWLTKMGDLGVNTLRIYTLLDPEFYNAFLLYNQLHPDRPIWLMQEIWPEEEPHGNDYLASDYQAEYEREIEHVIDAVHGNATIGERRGRAWGTYTSNVSAYVIGYLVGRELEPHEVEATDLLNDGYVFNGKYIGTTEDATPTEAWLAASLDYVLDYEESTYGWQHPVAIVNWPTLDPIDHPSERNEEGLKIKESNDRITVNINHLLPGSQLKAGLFGAYHIYPNYPDFMNNDPLYDQYEDEQGRFRYGGYLREFIQMHTAYPAVVAEFGLATGMGNAHISPDGYHHGSMTEEVQGEGIIRMFEAMRVEGYAGGIIFEWMDEWTKKTWTTEPYMIPYDRHILWHNAIDPEQNYGIIAYEAVKPTRAGAETSGSGAIEQVALRADASFLHIDITLKNTLDLDKERLILGIDTFARDKGELVYDPSLPVKAQTGMEYLIVTDGLDTARLLAIPPANGAEYGFSTYASLEQRGIFEEMRKLTNKARALEDGTPIAARYENSSQLRYGDLQGSTNHWVMKGDIVSIRIPWGRINVSDPSSGTVLNDRGTFYTDPLRDVLQTTQSEGIVVSGLLVQEKTDTILGTFSTATDAQNAVTLPWTPWNQPTYRERLKDSFHIIREYFTTRREQ